jgi:hypothetical protein
MMAILPFSEREIYFSCSSSGLMGEQIGQTISSFSQNLISIWKLLGFVIEGFYVFGKALNLMSNPN